MTKSTEEITGEILLKHSRRSNTSLSPATRLVDLVDSLGLLMVVLDLEHALGGRPFDVATAGSLVTVSDLYEAVRNGALT